MAEHPQYPQYPRQAGQWPGPMGSPPPGYAGSVQPSFPPPPGGGKRKRTRWITVAVVASVLVAAAAGGVWFWQRGGSGGSGGSAAGADKELTLRMEERFPENWQPDGPKIENTVGSWVDGRWWTDGLLVREMPGEVVAYDLAGGSAAWRVPVPGNGACLASRELSPEGHIAILRGDGFSGTEKKGCHQLTLVDVKAGKELWTVELDQIGRKFPTVADRPVIAGGMVHVSGNAGGQSRALTDGSLRLRDGKTEANGGTCRTTDYLGVKGTLVGWRECVGGDGNLPDRALVGYGENLEQRWTWIFPEGDRDTKLKTVLSVDPLVVVVTKQSRQEVWRVEPGSGKPDARGKHDVVVASGTDIMKPCLGTDRSSKLSVCGQIVVGDGVVYLQSLLDENGRRKGVVAFDLNAGKELWHARAAGELSLAPVRVAENGRLIAYQAEADESPGVVMGVDPGNGSLTPLAALPRAKPGKTVLKNTDLGPDDLDWRDARLAILSNTVVVTKDGGGGGAGSMATLIYS